MGSQQFSRAVRGSEGTPVATSQVGTIEVDNYDRGDAFDHDGTAYPYDLNPATVIQELVITVSGDVVAEITTTAGVTFDLPLAGATAAFDKWTIDSVTFKDPNGTGARIAGGWAGE